MNRLLAATLALGFAACNIDQEFAGSLPEAKQVAITVPQGVSNGSKASSVDGLSAQRSALVGETSALYQATVDVSTSLNAGTVAILGLLRLVTAQPATSRTADSRTWGPWRAGGLDPLTYRVVVTKLGEQHFGFSLEARSKLAANPDEFLAIVDGEVTRGDRPETGRGTMILHFDNRRRFLADACEDGTLAFDFDNTSDVVRNDVTLHAFANANPKNVLCQHDRVTDGAYHFDQDAAGAGNFVFTFNKDMVQPDGQTTSADEDVSIRSRWNASGAGRSDIVVAGSDVTARLAAAGLSAPVTASQCWDDRYVTTFQVSSPIEIMPSGGSASACVFASAELPQ